MIFLLGAAALAAVPLFRVPVYKVPWAQAKGRKPPSLDSQEVGRGKADSPGPDTGGPGPEAIQLPEAAPRTPAKA